MNYPEKATLFRQKVDNWLPKAGVGVGVNCNEHERAYWGEGNVLKLNCGDGHTTW